MSRKPEETVKRTAHDDGKLVTCDPSVQAEKKAKELKQAHLAGTYSALTDGHSVGAWWAQM